MCCKGCARCMLKIPFPSVIATVMCLSGSGIFLGSAYKGITLTLRMYEVVFQVKARGFIDLRLAFLSLSLLVAILGIILVIIGFLATGATRNKVYRGWKARMGGRVSCGVFLVTSYFVQIGWIVILACLTVILFVFRVSWGLCNNLNVTDAKKQCIDLTQFDFMFPNGTKYENLLICSEGKIKEFCKDYVEQAVVMYILATVACVLIIISLIHYGISLAANYTRIKNEKFADLQELQNLQDGRSIK
ncbi:proteolipid protein DM beta-like [Limulus polyphemus]|uniref:Proteolipid protein DM beta-like n=1 Tax=Limulus polyphemus TaxID=6850 RepID=A0ABM1S6T1_LIMPO|nr:proteolipid protein DM beta-like [Limulus polyphemus]